MSITCDRCRKEMKHELLHLALDDFIVIVTAAGRYRNEPDLCPACLNEIAKSGKIVEREPMFDSLSSPPSKGGAKE